MIVSLSGGKDSTAMLLHLLERGESIHSVVFFDTGWEFPQILEHISELERRTGIEIIRLKPKRHFDDEVAKQPVRSRRTGNIHLIGRGWPSMFRRWCTGRKMLALEKQSREAIKQGHQVCIGIAADEAHRVKKQSEEWKRYPLIEAGMTEADCLALCYRHGYRFGGVYEHFKRVSCYCCPMQRISELRTLRRYYPDLWQKMLQLDSQIQNNRGFKGYETVHDFERRFAEEDKQMCFNFDE